MMRANRARLAKRKVKDPVPMRDDSALWEPAQS